MYFWRPSAFIPEVTRQVRSLLLNPKNQLVTSSSRDCPAYPTIMAKAKVEGSSNVAILRRLSAEEPSQDKSQDKFTFSFRLTNNVDKQFNLCRNLGEDVTDFVARLRTNLDKVINKKVKKVKTAAKTDPSQSDETPTSPTVRFFLDDKEVEDLAGLSVSSLLLDPSVEIEVLGERFRVDVDPPMAESGKLPDTIMSGFPVYPLRLNFVNSAQEDSTFEWWVSAKVVEVVTASSDKKGPVKAKVDCKVNVQTLTWIKRSEGKLMNLYKLMVMALDVFLDNKSSS